MRGSVFFQIQSRIGIRHCRSRSPTLSLAMQTIASTTEDWSHAQRGTASWLVRGLAQDRHEAARRSSAEGNSPTTVVTIKCAAAGEEASDTVLE